MIVPTNRLLFWTGLVLLPSATLLSTVPAASLVALGLLVALVSLAVLDALRARRRMEGVSVDMPALVRLTQDRRGVIEMGLRSEGAGGTRIRIGLPLPGAIRSARQELTVTMPDPGQHVSVPWHCMGEGRGRYSLERIWLGGGSPMGFWTVRKSVAAATEVRVYPNLLSDQRQMASLFLPRAMVGERAQRQLGKGREFEHLRDYLPGDGYEDIHWKATAKRRRPVTKVFQVERTQEVYLVLDASRLSGRPLPVCEGFAPRGEAAGATGRSGRTMLDRFLQVALLMGVAARRQGDLFGVLTFSDQVGGFLRAGRGKAHFGACRDMLYALQPRDVAPDYSDVFTFLGQRLRRRALVVFLTHLDDSVLAEDFVSNLPVILPRHLVLVAMVKPGEASPLFTGGAVETVDDMYRSLGGHLLWAGLRQTEGVLKRHGAGFAMLESGAMGARLVSEYLRIKQGQLL